MRVPDGFAVVTPYLFVKGADDMRDSFKSHSELARLAEASFRTNASRTAK